MASNARTYIAKILKEGVGYVGGQWVRAASKREFEVVDPASLARLAMVAEMNDEDTRIAIAAAEAGFKDWSRTTARERARALRAWHDAVMREQEVLAVLMTAESGKPLGESRAEVAYSASFLEWFAEEAPRVVGSVDSGVGSDRRLVTVRQPIGVSACVTPWNFPMAMLTRKCGAALAAGSAVVVKPAEDTPLTALALAWLAQGIFPAGALNVVTTSRAGAERVGAALCDSDSVRALSFTGSTAVGQWLYERSAPTVKKLALELGGNAPFVVLDDADVELAAACAMASKMRNAGQTCICADRFIVHESVYGDFIEALLLRMRGLRMGRCLEDESANLGPLVNSRAANRAADLIAQARDVPGTRISETHVERVADLGGFNFVSPTLVEVPLDRIYQTRCWTNETFAPIVAVAMYSGPDDRALAIANSDPTGLAAYVVAGNLARGWRLAEKLEAGIVGVNEAIVSHAHANFGGIKQSGLGREGGSRGIDEFLEDKYICLGGLDSS